MIRIRLAIWRSRLKSRFLTYRAISDEYSCGAALAAHLSSRLRRAKDRVNEAIRKCRELDPECSVKELE